MEAVADRPVHQLYIDPRGLALAAVETALKVAVMVRAGFTRGEIASRLDISARAVRQAVADLQEVSDAIDLGDRPGEADEDQF